MSNTAQSKVPHVAFLVPAYNEATTISECVHALRAAVAERFKADIIVIDNNSTDATAELARRAGATVLHQPRQGKGHAIALGVAEVSTEVDWVAFHDADNEYNAEDMVSLVTTCIAYAESCKGNSDTPGLVMGVGLRQVELGSVLWRSVLANWVTRNVLRLRLKKKPPHDILTGARVFNASALRRVFATNMPILRGFELETAMTRRAMDAGLAILEGQVRYHPRAAHEKKITAFDLFPILSVALSWRTR